LVECTVTLYGILKQSHYIYMTFSPQTVVKQYMWLSDKKVGDPCATTLMATGTKVFVLRCLDIS